MRYLIWILIIFVSWNVVGHAASPTLPAMPVTFAQSGSAAMLAEENAPVPVPVPSEKAVRHYRSGNVLWCLRTAWALALPALLLFSGFSARLRNFARRLGRKWYFALCLLCHPSGVAELRAQLAAGLLPGIRAPHAYGLSNQTFEKWFGDSLKELAILFLCLAALSLAALPVPQEKPRRWWLTPGWP